MPTLTKTGLQITPIEDAPLGAVVIGLDANQAIAPEVILQLKQTLRDYHILIFKQQTLIEQQLFDFQAGAALVERLRKHLNQPRFYYQHKW